MISARKSFEDDNDKLTHKKEDIVEEEEEASPSSAGKTSGGADKTSGGAGKTSGSRRMRNRRRGGGDADLSLDESHAEQSGFVIVALALLRISFLR